MQNAEYKQFRLTDDGKILYQQDATNPLPGVPVAHVVRGESLLKPAVTLDDASADQTKLDGWIAQHVATVLEPLVALEKEEGIDGAAKEITQLLHASLGILHREKLETQIAALDDAGRSALRARHVRLGPVLVYLPSLGKPAAVKLRALLWNLWNDKALPALTPPDGITSLTVAGRDIDPELYQVIGYPVCGPRAVRADMLDRLICAVYDGADKGTFKAKHAMAEWLGCPIPDLYAVLEALGHTKISDPATEVKPEDVAVVPVEATPAAEAPVADAAALAEKPVQVKPDLATFRLRRGKAYGEAPQRQKPVRTESHKPREDKKKKPEGGKRPSHKGKPKDKKPERDNREDRVAFAAPAKQESVSPFDVLKGLKAKSGS